MKSSLFHFLHFLSFLYLYCFLWFCCFRWFHSFRWIKNSLLKKTWKSTTIIFSATSKASKTKWMKSTKTTKSKNIQKHQKFIIWWNIDVFDALDVAENMIVVDFHVFFGIDICSCKSKFSDWNVIWTFWKLNRF